MGAFSVAFLFFPPGPPFLVLNCAVAEKTVSRFSLEPNFPFYRLKENLFQIIFQKKKRRNVAVKTKISLGNGLHFEKLMLDKHLREFRRTPLRPVFP